MQLLKHKAYGSDEAPCSVGNGGGGSRHPAEPGWARYTYLQGCPLFLKSSQATIFVVLMILFTFRYSCCP